MKLFNKILIANRAEIAIRIIKSAKLLGIKTVAIYTESEKDALHVKKADESFSLGSGELNQTYLNIEKIITAAKEYQCEAIHPGYGFLAENPLFVEACEDNSLVFIGPSADAMRIMGNKIAARDFINKIKIPTTKGITGSIETLKRESKNIPFPILIKAAAGGGGKGMRIVNKPEELDDAIESTSREALNYFGNDSVYIEQFIEDPRHIEIQLLSDHFGNHIHLYERECSIQRRYQKIIEESPSPTLTQDVREEMGKMAVKIAQEIGYRNAGTIEFLVDKNLNYYFLEMNTRVQVEHPVTEMVTNVDIVKEQIIISAGNQLSYKQSDIKQHGHAIECRIYAEDPGNNFVPSPGEMTLYNEPKDDNIRIDSAIEKATVIERSYDPMISKQIVWGTNREEAINNTLFALKSYAIHGIKTNIEFLITLLQNNHYQANNISTKFCENNLDQLLNESKVLKNSVEKHNIAIGIILNSLNQKAAPSSIWNSIGYWRDQMNFSLDIEGEELAIRINTINDQVVDIEIDSKIYIIRNWSIDNNVINAQINNQQFKFYVSTDIEGKTLIMLDGFSFSGYRKDMLLCKDFSKSSAGSNGEDSNHIYSPMPGKVIKINVSVGDTVSKGDNLLIVEAMKMENNITAHKDGKIMELTVNVNDMVTSQKALVTFED